MLPWPYKYWFRRVHVVISKKHRTFYEETQRNSKDIANLKFSWQTDGREDGQIKGHNNP